MGNSYAHAVEMPVFDRIREWTNPEVNARIEDAIRKNVECHSHSPEAIEKRLAVLDHEWDVDRALMALFSAIAFTALSAGTFRQKRWLFLPAIQLPLLFFHAARGWCPPLPILRRLGYRSRQEIEAEKMELRKLGARNYSFAPEATTA